MNFWYTFVYPVRSILEINRDAVVSRIVTTYDQYLGRIFEDIAKQYLMDLNIAGKLPFAFERIGRQWGKIPGKQKGINTYEIDVVALNENSKDIMFVECKWQTLTANNTRRIFDDLKEKSKYVRWNNEERKKYFAVVAKKIERKSKLRDEGMIVFDLDDISA